MRRGGSGVSYINPCLTMHQPWASLLVHGIKRIEGRSWPTPLRGRLWIHAASKVPDPATIKAMEDFYKEIYAVNGIMDLKFPESYPVSQLLGCVEVVGCIKCEELIRWEEVPEAVRLEGLTDFCWLCEKPQKLLVPFEMRGYKGVYNLESQIYEAAIRGLCQIEGPQLVKFPLPDPHDPLSLKPGSLLHITSSKMSTIEKTPSLNAAIAGARAAATQFSKKEVRYQPNTVQGRRTFDSSSSHRSEDKFTEVDKRPTAMSKWRSNERYPVQNYEEQRNIIKPPSLSASMAGTPAAATEFYRKEAQQNNTFPKRRTFNSSPRQYAFNQEDRKGPVTVQWRPQQRGLVHNYKEQSTSVNLPSPTAAIATARAAGTQSTKMEMHRQKSTVQERHKFDSLQRQHSENQFTEEDRMSTRKPTVTVQRRPQERGPVYNYQEQNNHECESNSTSGDQDHLQDANERLAVPSKIFAAAMRGLRLT